MAQQNFETMIRMREHKAKQLFVLVRGPNPFSYYGEYWAGGYKLCKAENGATPVTREEAEKIVNDNVNSLAYIVPITHEHAAHLARCWAPETACLKA